MRDVSDNTRFFLIAFPIVVVAVLLVMLAVYIVDGGL
jgi:hypothetical protein